MSQNVEERLDSYTKRLEELKERKDPGELVDFIESSGLDKHLGEKREHVVSTLKRFREDESAVDVMFIVDVIAFLITIIGLVKNRLDKYKYVPLWAKTEKIPHYNYHVMGSSLYTVFNKYLRGRYRKIPESKRRREVGFVFGDVDSKNIIRVNAFLPFWKIIHRYGRKENIGYAYKTLVSMVGSAAEDYVVRGIFRLGKKLLCTVDFENELIKERKTFSERMEFLNEKLIGMYIYEDELLRHDVVTGRRLNQALKKIGLNKRLRGIIKQYPKYLFLERGDYDIVKGYFDTMREKLDFKNKVPPMVLCFDRRKESNCVCVGYNPQFGYQRIRHRVTARKIIRRPT